MQQQSLLDYNPGAIPCDHHRFRATFSHHFSTASQLGLGFIHSPYDHVHVNSAHGNYGCGHGEKLALTFGKKKHSFHATELCPFTKRIIELLLESGLTNCHSTSAVQSSPPARHHPSSEAEGRRTRTKIITKQSIKCI